MDKNNNENADDSDTKIFRLKDTNEKIVKRKARWSDLPDIQILGETVDFHAGLHNARLYFETSPGTWFVAINENQELIAYDTHNKLPLGDIRVGYQLVVREDYRGLGLTRFFETMHYSKHPALGNATGDSLLRYRFENFEDKLIGYEGHITENSIKWIKEQQQGDLFDNSEFIELNEITHSNVFRVLEYDLSILRFDRSAFLTEWILPDKYPCRSMGILAKDVNGITVGFGAIRECHEYFVISPLYADNDYVAQNLLYSLASNVPCGNLLYIQFPAKNRLVFEFIHKLNFGLSEAEIRYYSNLKMSKSKTWDMSRVYALQDYYPV